MSPKKQKIKVDVKPNTEPEPSEQEELESVDEVETTATGEEMEAEVQTVADDEIAALQEQLDQTESRANEYLEGLQRERAAFQNYKRRVERERVEQRQALLGDVLAKLLPAMDDFHRAMDTVPSEERDDWYNGVALIQRKLDNVLKDFGVTEIEAEGAPFDPNFHEAVGVDMDSEAESGTVTLVMQRGYKLQERVLRPAMVRVAE